MKPVRLFFIPLAILLVWPGAAFIRAEELSEYSNPFTWVRVGQVTVRAEVVRTPEKLYLGLSHRQELPEGRGMLFFMPAREVQNFCMRGMQFPIDILWVGPGKIVGIEKEVSPRYPGTLRSPAPVSHVLELPGGFSVKYGIKVGDSVSWE